MGAGRHRRPGIVVARTGPVMQALGVITAGVVLVGGVLALTPGGIGSIELRSGDPSTRLTSVPSLAPSEAPPAGPGSSVPGAGWWMATTAPVSDTPAPEAPPSEVPPVPTPGATPPATVPPAAPEPPTPEPTTAEPTTSSPEPTPTPSGRPSRRGPPSPLPTPTHRGPGEHGGGSLAPAPAG